jgi:hypothetical protein
MRTEAEIKFDLALYETSLKLNKIKLKNFRRLKKKTPSTKFIAQFLEEYLSSIEKRIRTLRWVLGGNDVP